MKLAVLSCIHGNYEALNEVLLDIDRHRIDQIYRSFSTLDELKSVLVQRCQVLLEMNDDIQARTNFHWWHYAAS